MLDDQEYVTRYNELYALLARAYKDYCYLQAIGDVGGRVGFEDAVTNAVSHICELLKTDLCLLIWKACIDTGSDTNTLKSLKNAAYKAYKLVPKDKYFQNISEEATNAITQMRSYAIAHILKKNNPVADYRIRSQNLPQKRPATSITRKRPFLIRRLVSRPYKAKENL